MRLIAALMVVIHHARGFLLPVGFIAPAPEAVTFFFVLSGFILTYSYHHRSYSLREFYVARIARIVPVTLLSIALFLALNHQSVNLASPRDLAIMTSNMLLIQAWIPIPSYYFALNAVVWSVSAELVFYALFPFLQRSLHQTSGRLLVFALPLCISGLLMLFCLWMNLPAYDAADLNRLGWIGLVYIHPLARLKEFCFGMLAALVYIRLSSKRDWLQRNKALLSLTEFAMMALLAAGFAMISIRISQNPEPVPIFGYQVLTGILFACFIVLIACQVGFLSRQLNKQWLVTGGEISFSIYLFHQILLVWQSRHPWLLNWAPVHARFPIALLVIVAISYAVWRWFEKPMRTQIRRLFDKR